MSSIHRDFRYKGRRVVIEDSALLDGFMVWVDGTPVGCWPTEPEASAAGYAGVELAIRDEALREELEAIAEVRSWVSGPTPDASLTPGTVVWAEHRGRWHRGRVESVAQVRARVVFLTKKGGKLKRVSRRFENLVVVPT